MKKLFSLKSCKQPVSVTYAFKGETNKMPFVIGCAQICFQPVLHVSVTSLYFARICESFYPPLHGFLIFFSKYVI